MLSEGIKTNYIVDIPKQWRMGLNLFFQKKYKKMETKLSMSVMQHVLAACSFFIINICSTGMKTFFILLFICYI